MVKYARKGPKPVPRKALPPLPPPTVEGFIEIASRSTKVVELRMLWRNARELGLLTKELRQVIIGRVGELDGAQNVP